MLSHSGGVAPGNQKDRAELLAQRGQLSQDVSSLRLAVTQLEREVTRLRGDITDLGEAKLTQLSHHKIP